MDGNAIITSATARARARRARSRRTAVRVAKLHPNEGHHLAIGLLVSHASFGASASAAHHCGLESAGWKKGLRDWWAALGCQVEYANFSR